MSDKCAQHDLCFSSIDARLDAFEKKPQTISQILQKKAQEKTEIIEEVGTIFEKIKEQEKQTETKQKTKN